jgi:hypothetical protein
MWRAAGPEVATQAVLSDSRRAPGVALALALVTGRREPGRRLVLVCGCRRHDVQRALPNKAAYLAR